MAKIFVVGTAEGCALNLQEMASYRARFATEGHEIVATPEDADRILINSCGVRKLEEDRTLKLARELQTRHPRAEVVLSGCLPKINPVRVKQEFSGSVVREAPREAAERFSQNHEFHKPDFNRLALRHQFFFLCRSVAESMERRVSFRFQPLHNIFTGSVVNEKFHLVTVSTGCLGSCTFCGIKKAKGSLRSRPLGAIIEDVQAGYRAGARRFWLLCDDLGCWGLDTGSNVVELLSQLFKQGADIQFVLNYFDPTYLVRHPKELVELLSDPRIMAINMPIQTGSSRILGLMKRDHELKRVYALLREIKRRRPGVAIKTNVIVGFPTETWWDFLLSLLVLPHFDAIFPLVYSARPNTVAAEMPGQIPHSIKTVRLYLFWMAAHVRHLWVALRSLARPESA
jgi:threonylcarbamoyladenosine tRNA methylthiotransferase CDKAL1